MNREKATKVAVLYDLWEEEPEPPPPPETPAPRKGRRRRRKPKQDREEIFAALQKLGYEPSYQVVDGRPQSLTALSRCDTELFFNLAADRIGSTALHLGHALFLTSLIAAMISFHNIISRYAFSLGREGVLPRALGRTVPGEEEKVAAPVVKFTVQVGDTVKVKEGAFESFEGTVDALDETSGKVKVMIEIFGRSTEVELEHWQIEKI